MGSRENPLHSRRTIKIPSIRPRPEERRPKGIWCHHLPKNNIGSRITSFGRNHIRQELPINNRGSLRWRRPAQIACRTPGKRIHAGIPRAIHQAKRRAGHTTKRRQEDSSSAARPTENIKNSPPCTLGQHKNIRNCTALANRVLHSASAKLSPLREC